MRKIWVAKKQNTEIAPFVGLALMFFFLGLAGILWNYFDFLEIEGLNISHFLKIPGYYGYEDLLLYKLAMFCGYATFICFIFVTEVIIKKTKFLISFGNIICACYGIIFMPTTHALRIYTYITMPIIVFTLLISYSYVLVVKTKGLIRQRMEITFIIFFFYAISQIINTEGGKAVFSFIPEDFVNLVAMIGLLVFGTLWGYYFVRFETITEFDWGNKLKELYIIDSKHGLNYFYYSFSKMESEINPQLISAGLSGIQSLIARMLSSRDHLHVVDHQDLKLLFEYGKYVTIILIVSEDLKIIRLKLSILMKEFESFFREILPEQLIEMSTFLPTKYIIEQVFEFEGEQIGEVKRIKDLIKKFVLLSMLTLIITGINGMIVILINLFSQPPLIYLDLMANILSSLVIIPTILILYWVIRKIIQKKEFYKENLDKLLKNLLFSPILCISYSALGIFIFLITGNILIAFILIVINVIASIFIILYGIYYLENLEREIITERSEKKNQ